MVIITIKLFLMKLASIVIWKDLVKKNYYGKNDTLAIVAKNKPEAYKQLHNHSVLTLSWQRIQCWKGYLYLGWYIWMCLS